MKNITLRSLVGRPAVAGLLVLGFAATTVGATTPATAGPVRHPTVTWNACPNYSDEVLRARSDMTTSRYLSEDGFWPRVCPTSSLRVTPGRRGGWRCSSYRPRWRSSLTNAVRQNLAVAEATMAPSTSASPPRIRS